MMYRLQADAANAVMVDFFQPAEAIGTWNDVHQ
jgi:hypothetical protein